MNQKNIFNSDVTKYMATLYTGYLLGRSSELLGILSVPIEIVGFASIVIVVINLFRGKKQPS